MSEEYPVLDDASMKALVDDFERKENLSPLEDPPLPPEAEHDLESPVIDETPPFIDGVLQEDPRTVGFSAPIEDSFIEVAKEDAPSVNKVSSPVVVPVDKDKEDLIPVPVDTRDVQDLALLENVFDKRITDDDVQREMAVETRNDSGRLLDKEDVEVKTELNDAEILTMSKLLLISDRYSVPVLREFTDNLMTLKISRNRKGRTEFIQGLHADERREQPSEGFFSKIFGGKN